MRLSYTDVFQHNTSYQGHNYLFRRIIKILKWTANFLLLSRLVKHHGWGLISFDYVGAEQVL